MKKNIAIIVSKLSGGGAERVASNLSLYLSNEKYEKHIITFHKTSSNYKHEGNLIELNTQLSKNPLSKLVNNIKRFIQVKQIKKKYNIETTVSLLSTPNIINIFTKKNDKIIVSVRNFVSNKSFSFYGYIYKVLMKLFYNRADVIVVVSEAIKQDLIKNYGLNKEKIKVIYNFYNIEQISQESKKNIDNAYNKIFEKPTIITAGRLSLQKGQWHLIRAFKKLNKEKPDVQLVILGIGNLESYLKNMVKGMGLENNVHFLGFQTNPFKYISKSSLFVLPSLHEGFPNVLCEAMACGIPVISSDCLSGPREILAPNTDLNSKINNIEYGEHGLLVPVCDGETYSYDAKLTKGELEIYKSMSTMLADKDLLNTYANASIKRVNEFREEKILKFWDNII